MLNPGLTLLVTLSVPLLLITASPIDPFATTIRVPLSERNSILKRDVTSVVNGGALQRQLSRAVNKVVLGATTLEANTGTTLAGFNLPSFIPSRFQKRQWFGHEPLVDEQGEVLWAGDIYIGVPPRKFLIDFDTGSSDLWVPSSNITFRNHTYDASKSFTSKVVNASDTAFRIGYGDGSGANGPLVSDAVAVASLVAFDQVFCPTVNETGFSASPTDSDGILGLAYQAIASTKSSPFFHTLFSQGHVWRNLFTFYLADTGSELILGGSDPSKYIQPFIYTPVTQQAFYMVTASILFNGENILPVQNGSIIDTGTTLLVAPPASAAAFFAKVPNSRSSVANPGLYEFPCTQNISVSISFPPSNIPFEIPSSFLNLGVSEPNSTYCIASIAAQDTGLSGWIIGDIFLRSVYTEFNLETNSVGFAKLR